MTERGAAPRPLRMRIALSPRRHAALYAAVHTLSPPARTSRLLTLATVGLALGAGAVTLLPRAPAGAAGTTAPLMLRVAVPRQVLPELHQALAALGAADRRATFLAWAQAGLAQLHDAPPTPRAADRGPPPVTVAAPPAPPPPAAGPVLTPPVDPSVAPPVATVRRLVRNMGLSG